jgi:hypothetical protein
VEPARQGFGGDRLGGQAPEPLIPVKKKAIENFSQRAYLIITTPPAAVVPPAGESPPLLFSGLPFGHTRLSMASTSITAC